MKHLLTILAVALIGAPVMANDAVPGTCGPEENNPACMDPVPQPAPVNDLLGGWKTERPTRMNPYAVAYGEVEFTETSVVYTSICSYHNGPVLTASVEAPVEYRHHSFRILRSEHQITHEDGFSCEAYLGEGPISYRHDDGKLYLASYRTGWRMTLLRK